MRRYDVVRQSTDNECGAAVLASVARHYGRSLPLSWLRERMGIGTHGCDLAALQRAATDLGFEAHACEATWDVLAIAPRPAVLHVTTARGGHFVVLYDLGPDHVILGDPERGVVRSSKAEHLARWSGATLLLVPTERFAAAPAPRTLRLGDFIRTYLRSWRLAVAALLAAAAATALTTVLALFIQYLVDRLLRGRDPTALDLAGLGMAAIVVFQGVFSLARSVALLVMSRRLDYELESRCHRHVLAQPMTFFASRRVGEIAARFTESAKVADLLGVVLMPVAFDSAVLVLAACYLMVVDWRPAVLCIAVGPMLAGLMIGFRRLTAASQRRLLTTAALLQSTIVSNLGGIAAIKAYGREAAAARQADQALRDTLVLRHRLEVASAVMQAVTGIVVGGFTVAVLWVGGRLVIDGAITAGALMSFYAMLGYIIRPLRNLTASGFQLQEAVIAAERTGDLLSLEREVDIAGAAGDADAPAITGAIELRGVEFSYDKREPTLRGIDLAIPAGSTLAIVGESGSGKSTLARLLLRFNDTDRGTITIDGRGLASIAIERLRAGIAWVDQDATVLDGTVHDNIVMGRPSATPDEIAAAVRAACVDVFVARLPLGLDTRIGERGGRLSGGERQRICIARALLRRAPILILDEATSHLDSETELAIQAAIQRSRLPRTTIVIAHRLSTIAHADQIVVLDRGAIVERGRHVDLLGGNGIYARMWNRQASGPLAAAAAS